MIDPNLSLYPEKPAAPIASPLERALGRLGRVLRVTMAFALVVGLVAGVAGYWVSRRPHPPTSGEVRVGALDGPVEIIRDEWGIPHIYATTTHDLFLAQGFVHAQDRFWQMDTWRAIGQGRVAAMFGAEEIDTDRFLRTLAWGDVAAEELAQMPDFERTILESYARGVNAYMGRRSPAELALEYVALEASNREYNPAAWDPVNSLTFLKVMAWDLRNNFDEEIDRAVLTSDFGHEVIAELYPPYPADHPVIVTGSGPAPAIGELSPPPALTTAIDQVRRNIEPLDSVAAGGFAGLGSNSWVVSGSRTASGLPLLANDPHLPAQMPSIWYEVGLHCMPRTDECPWDVTGFSFAGAPGVVIGHNDRIAWGLTNLNADVMDLYIERVNPDNPNQYEVDGRWVDMEISTERIAVAGVDPIGLTVRRTRHGPVISDDFSRLESFDTDTAVRLPSDYVITLSWTALQPARTFEALIELNLAGDWEEFRTAASKFDLPAQNLIYADVEGNIGYQTPGRIPVRRSGNGAFVAPGWTRDYDWTGFVAFDDLPSVLNPPKGYIVTANNPVVGANFPQLLGTDFAYGYRAARIDELLTDIEDATVADMQAIQLDSLNVNAIEMMPYLLEIETAASGFAEAKEILADWDLRNEADSAGAAIFEATWRQVLQLTFDEINDDDVRPMGDGRWYAVIAAMLRQPDHALWDVLATPQVENRDEILRLSMVEAGRDVARLLGDDADGWAWGDLHTVTFENQTVGQSGFGFVDDRFNRGPFPVGGGSSIVNATGWDARGGFEVAWLPSMRMVVDLGDLSASQAMHTTGQSGHAYHAHYQDMIEPWRLGEYHEMLWLRQDVEDAADQTLRLVP